MAASVLSSCFLGGPKCESGEERTLRVTRDLTEDEVGELSPETSDGDCAALCERFTRQEAKDNNYSYDGVATCSYSTGTLTCSARVTVGGCSGGYLDPALGGAGGVGGAAN